MSPISVQQISADFQPFREGTATMGGYSAALVQRVTGGRPLSCGSGAWDFSGAWYFSMRYDNNVVNKYGSNHQKAGFSVRYVKN